MPAAQKFTIKSPAQNWTQNGTLRFSGNVPTRGPNGGRTIIDTIEVVFAQSDTTVTVAATEGEDLWRAVENLVIEQVDGVQRYNLQGDALRIMDYDVLGAGRVPEWADLGIAANQALAWSFPAPLSKPFCKRPTDFGLPADCLKEVRLTCALNSASGIAIGGGTIVFNSTPTYYLLYHCHEEFSVEMKVVDMITSAAFPSTSGITFKAGGRLQNLHIYARAANGGGSATGLTELRIDGILPDPLLRQPDLLQPYLRARLAATADANAADGSAVFNDPAAAGRSIPVLFTNEETSSFDGKISDDVIVRVTGGSLASAIALYRVVLPRSEQLELAVMRAFDLDESEFKVKTVNKTRRGIHQWDPEQEYFMTRVAPLKSRGLRAA